ncbi:hypothetical protein [Sorangium cellulosum]|nr:hypothetical protein [Sorangium cellulosum]
MDSSNAIVAPEGVVPGASMETDLPSLIRWLEERFTDMTPEEQAAGPG